MEPQNEVTKDKIFERYLMDILGDITSIHNHFMKKNEFAAGFELCLLQHKILDMISQVYEDAKQKNTCNETDLTRHVKNIRQLCEKQDFKYFDDSFNFLHAPYLNGHC